MSESLQSLLEGIYGSVLEARRFVNGQHLKLFESYFETRQIDDPDTGDEVSVYTPRTVPIATSKGVGAGEQFDIVDAPVLTLIPISTLAIDRFEIEFEAKIANLDTVSAQPDKDDNQDSHKERRGIIRRTIDDLFGSSSDLTVMTKGNQFKSGASPAKVKVTFKMHDPPEGAALLQEQLLDYIRQK